ncbi:MAG: glycosyltransferase family 2 protein [Deinococcales bacterium]
MGDVEISVIVPTHERRDLVAALLTRLRNLPGPAREVIVIDDASTDGTAAMLCEAGPGVRVLRNEVPRRFDALADAVEMARGWLILQLDDDAYPAPETLTRVVEHFRRRGEALGMAALPFLDPATERPMLTSFLPDLPAGADYGPTPGFLAGAVAVRREAALAIPLSPPGYAQYQTEPAALIEYLHAGWEADFLATAPVYHLWAGRTHRISFDSAFLPLRNDIVTIKRYYRGWRRSEMLIGRYLTGFVHLLAAGYPQAWPRALRDAERMLASLPERHVEPSILQRIYPCFAGATLTSLLSPINARRIAWYLGLLPIDQIG